MWSRVARATCWMWSRVARVWSDILSNQPPRNDPRRLLRRSTRYQVLPPDKRLTTNEHQEQHDESKTILAQGCPWLTSAVSTGRQSSYQLDRTPAESTIPQPAAPQCRANTLRTSGPLPHSQHAASGRAVREQVHIQQMQLGDHPPFRWRP